MSSLLTPFGPLIPTRAVELLIEQTAGVVGIFVFTLTLITFIVLAIIWSDKDLDVPDLTSK